MNAYFLCSRIVSDFLDTSELDMFFSCGNNSKS